VSNRTRGIAKRADPLPAPVGEDLTYTLTVANQGAGDATEVVVLDWPAAKVHVVSLPEPCRPADGQTVHCWLGSLEAGLETQLRLVVRPENPGLLVNRARVKAAESDLNQADNEVTLKTRVIGHGGHLWSPWQAPWRGSLAYPRQGSGPRDGRPEP
jgi:uncharacterized repeat protein (TIGR01451 family)